MVQNDQEAAQNWNISRMECKGDIVSVLVGEPKIGIYPEWNVKKKIGKI